jgi:hypothetical protein
MPKNRKTRKTVRWANNINKPLETSEFINMSNNAVFARKSVRPSKTRHIEENEDNVIMNTIIHTPSYTNNNTNKRRNNLRNNRRATKRRRPTNWNNISNNEYMTNNEGLANRTNNNEYMSNNNYYDPEENAEIIRKMAALKRNINRNKRR